MSPNEVRIKMDQGTLTQFPNGSLTISGKAGCVNWGLFVITVLMTLGAVATTIYLAVKLFEPNTSINLSLVFQGLGITAFLGYGTFYLFGKVRFKGITIDTTTRLIKIDNRTIPFLEVAEIITEARPVPLMEEAVATSFIAILSSGERVRLGSITGESKKIGQPVEQIQTILANAFKGKN